jgi:hypothetical protein
MFAKFDNFFPLGSKAIHDVKIVVQCFIEASFKICYHASCVKHKNDIKIKFMTQHKTKWKMPMYVCLTSLTDPKEIFPIKPISWNEVSKCMFFCP